VYRSRLTGARMADPNNADIEHDVTSTLIEEADAGHVPLGPGADSYVLIEPVPHVSPFERGTAHPAPFDIERYRYPIIGVAAVLVVLVLWALFASEPPIHAAPAPEPAATPEPTPTAWSATQSSVVLANILPGASAQAAPASLEVAGVVYPIQPTQVENGFWRIAEEPGVASWLEGATVNLVFCLEALPALDYADRIAVRDTTGAVRTFQVSSMRTVDRHQIEVLSQRTVRLTLLTCSGAGAERSIITATYQ
jgi:hypothetical protein